MSEGLLGDLLGQTNPGGVSDDEPEDSKPGKGPSLAKIVADSVLGLYDLFCTPEGEAFAVAKPRVGPRIAIRLGARGGALRAIVQREIFRHADKVVTSSALDTGLGVVIATALGSEDRTPLHLRVAQGPGYVVLDLGNPNDARCIGITAEGWAVYDEPPAGIYFDRRRTTMPLPVPEQGGTFELLRKVLGFGDTTAEWRLVRGWLVASMFPSIPRPLLLLLGAAGSAKTSRAKALLGTLDPREHLGSSFGKSLDDDRVMASSRYLVAWDNVSRMSADVSDHLCRLVTGDSSEKRSLFTDGDQFVMSYRRTGIMTAISLPPMRPDALERVIPLHLGRLGDADRVSETVIAERLLEAHPQALGAICDGVVRVLRHLPALITQDPSGPRMKDYWMALAAYDVDCATAYAQSVEDVLLDAAIEDPFVQVVLSWLRQHGQNGGWWQGSAQQAYELAGVVRAMFPLGSGHEGWWPSTASHFSRALAVQERPLEKAGVRIHRSRNKSGVVLTFGPMGDPYWETGFSR